MVTPRKEGCMEKTLADLGDYERIAGNLALDFANTMGGGREIAPLEYLKSYAHLAAWAVFCELISQATARRLIDQAQTKQNAATEVLHRAVSLREAIYRVVTASDHRGVPKNEDLFLISREYQFAIGRAKIVDSKSGFSWQWPESKTDLDQMLWPVAKAAAELLTSNPHIEFLRECAADSCTWVFLDTSKNHKRRWCDMRDCGNREKMKRFRKT